ncbi:MAG: ABC transporter substrate-binding protein [Sedimentisphaerales bacterium]|nr:ABC transporter substrate-binding protein [Sedimentisphaerales bacterium]
MNISKTLFAFMVFLITGVFISLGLNTVSEQPSLNHPVTGPQRIICITPAITEIVFALGCQQRVRGVSDFCTWPPEVVHKDKIGGFFNPNYERLTALNPDMIIAQGRSEKIIAFCRQKNIPFLSLELNDLETIKQEIIMLGEILDCVSEAQELCQDMTQQIDDIRNKLQGVDKKRIFFTLGRTSGLMKGLSTIDGNSFMNELIEVAGGINIFADIQQPYPQISKETLVKRRPEVIIEAHPGETLDDKRQNELISDWQALGDIPAVTNNQIYFLTEDYLLIPGVRLGQTARRLTQVIHPEIFSE